MKKLLIIVLLIFLFGCTSYKNEKKAFIEEYQYYENQENIPKSWTWFDYQEFEKYLDYNRVIKLGFNKLKEEINKGEEIFVYYGFDPRKYQCPYCVSSLPASILAANEADVYMFAYDIFLDRQNQTENYLYLYNGLVDAFPDFPEKIYAPTFVVYKNKVPVSYHVSTIKDGEGKSLLGLNEAQTQTLKNIFLNMFSNKE